MGESRDAAPRVRVALLGPTTLTVGDESVALGGPKQRAVLALLALQAGRAVQPAQLISVLWPAGPPPAAANTVQVYVSRLRRLLGDGADGPRLRTTGGAYLLDLPPDAVDALLFEQLAARGRAQLASGEARAAASTLRQALDLWRGAPLPDLVGLADSQITRFEALRRAALAERVDADLALGRNAVLVPELEELVGANPLDERLVAQMMTALYGAGRQADALTAYAAAGQRLADDLGVDPSPELRRHYERVLRQELEAPGRGETADVVPPGGAQAPAVTPAAATDVFVGRAGELAEVLRLLARDDVRLVSLLGPGGAGKTRLAREVAARLDADDRDGDGGAGSAVTVPLAAVTRADDVLPEVCRVIGAEPDWAGEPPPATAARALSGTGLVLILDNLEQIPEVGAVVAALLQQVSALKVLVTSRHGLGLAGEEQFRLQPLPVPEAGTTQPLVALDSDSVRLFRDRARLVLPDFEVLPENVAAICELCRRLDGLPLALELVAARVRVMPPAEILNRLDRALALLGGGSEELAERHRSMWATVDWSVRMLDPVELRVFAQLSVFSAGWTVAAAESVCAGESFGGLSAEDPVLDVLQRLVARSLVVADGSGRMSMLETIRQYAAQLLAGAPARLRETRERHARFFAELAEELGPRAFVARLTDEGPSRALAADSANLTVALAFSREEDDVLLGRLVTALVDHWYMSNQVREAEVWVRAAQEVQLPAESRVRLLQSLSNLRIAGGDLPAALEYCVQAGAAAEALDDTLLRTRALVQEAVVHRLAGRAAQAYEIICRAYELAATLGVTGFERAVRLEVSELLDELGRSAEAEAIWNDLLAESIDDEDADHHTYALTNLARLAVERGDGDLATSCVEESLEVARAADIPLLVDALAAAGVVELALGRPAAAAARLAEALRLSLGFGQLISVPENVGLLGAARLVDGHGPVAARLLGAAATWRTARGISSGTRLSRALITAAEAELAARVVSDGRLGAERVRGARTRFGSLRGIAALDPAVDRPVADLREPAGEPSAVPVR